MDTDWKFYLQNGYYLPSTPFAGIVKIQKDSDKNCFLSDYITQ